MILVALLSVSNQTGFAQAQEVAPPEPFEIEFYYKVKWGYFNEFYVLYRKNHYPILQRLQEMGRILSMEAAFPINHAGESDRWDMRFTMVYPSAAIGHEEFDRSGIVRELYPDQELFRKEEQRRFALLLEHTDIEIKTDDLSEWDTR